MSAKLEPQTVWLPPDVVEALIDEANAEAETLSSLCRRVLTRHARSKAQGNLSDVE